MPDPLERQVIVFYIIQYDSNFKYFSSNEKAMNRMMLRVNVSIYSFSETLNACITM